MSHENLTGEGAPPAGPGLKLTGWALGLGALVAGPVALLAPRGLAPLAGLVGLLCLVDLLRHRQGSFFLRQPLVWTVALLLVWMVASSTWALVPADALSTLHGLAPLLLAGLLAGCMAGRVPPALANRVGRLLVIGFCLAAILLIIDSFGHGLIVRAFRAPRRSDYVWHAADLSQLVVWVVLLGWGVAIWFWRRGMAAAAIVTLLAIHVLAWTGDQYVSRLAALVGLAAFLLVYWRGSRAVLALFGLVILFVLFMPLLPSGPLNPDLYRAWLPEIRYSGLHRLFIWRFAADRVAEHPWLGWGLDSSRSMPGSETMLPTGGQQMALHPHNGVLQIWLELGVVGALLMISTIALLGRSLLRSSGDRFVMAAGTGAFFTCFIILASSFGLWQNWWVGTFSLAAACLVLASRANAALPDK